MILHSFRFALVLTVVCSAGLQAQTRDTLFTPAEELLRLGIDTANTQQVLDSLFSESRHVRYLVISYCRDAKLRAALPLFKVVFQQHPTEDENFGDSSRRLGDRAIILSSVIKMNDTTFQEEFHMEIDSMRTIPEDLFDLLLFSSYLMERHGDPYGFSAIYPYFAQPNNPEIDTWSIGRIAPFLHSIYHDDVVNVLLSNYISSQDLEIRGAAIWALRFSGDPRVEDTAIELAKNDTSQLVRGWYALPTLEYLRSHRYIPTIIEMLQTEPDTSFRITLYKYLMDTRQPAAYRYVFDVQRQGNDPSVEFYAKDMDLYYSSFRPDTSLSRLSLIDSLRAQMAEVAGYGWVGGGSFVNELDGHLSTARGYLLAGDSLNCGQQLREFQIKLRSAKDSSTASRFVTLEGYKFLFYMTQHIRNRLPGTLSLLWLFPKTIGNGTIQRYPNYVDHDSGSTVQITAIADEGSYFIAWSGDASGSQNPLSVTMNSDKRITATFKNDLELASENKSSSSDATACNSARHLAKSGEYLHEVFASGGEIFYRRSTDGGSSWDQTHRTNVAVGQNSHPCITATKSGTIAVVWQREIGDSTYEVWHSYSQDNGGSWSTPAILPDAEGVVVSGYQTQGPMPVISEGRYLITVFCSNQGLRYRISEDEGVSWQVPEHDIIGGQSNNRVCFPSLAGGDSYASLLYDYVDDNEGPYSRIFDGSLWSDEEKVAKGAIGSDGAFPSVAIGGDGNPVAVWSGSINPWTRSVVFRTGYSDNTWSHWYDAFGQGQLGPDWVFPSVTYYKRDGGQDAIAIVNHTSSHYVKLTRYVNNGLFEAPYWTTSTLSESGAWASISQENASSGKPLHCFTDQSAFPYAVVTASSTELSMRNTGDITNASSVRRTRRAVVSHPRLRSTLMVEFEPMKIVSVSGDTSLVPFKTPPRWSRGERDSITLGNMWDYLGSEAINVPSNARRLIVTKQFTTRGPVIAKQRFWLRVLNASGLPVAVLDSTGTSGTVSLNIAPYAGMNVWLRPQLTLQGIDPPNVSVAVGDVYTLPNDPTVKPKGRKEGK